MPPFFLKTYPALLSFLAAIALYGNSLDNSFAWDDHYLIVNNPGVQNLENVAEGFFSPWAADSAVEGGRSQNSVYWRPVTQLTYALDWSLGEGSPQIFHLTNTLLHGLNSALVALLMGLLWPGFSRDASRAGLGALIAGLLFAVHPVHTEAIHLITYRTTLLATAGGLASLVLFYKNHKLLALIPLLLGLLSKEEAIVTPAVIFLLDWGQGVTPSSWKGRIRRYLPMIGLSLGYLAIHQSITTGATLNFFAGQAADTVVFTMAKVLWLDARLMLMPWPLTPFYDWSIFPYAHHPFHLEVALGFGIALLFLAPGLRSIIRKETPSPWATLSLVFLATLLPYSHIVPFFDVAGERFLYFPSMAFCLAGGLFASSTLNSQKRALKIPVGVCIAVLMVTFSWKTWERGPDFRNTRTLLEATQEDFPNSYFTAFELGRTELKSHNLGAAELQFRRAMKILPLEVAALCTAESIRRQGKMEHLRRFLDENALNHAGLPHPEINRIRVAWGSGKPPTSIRCDEGNMLETSP